MPKPSFEKNSCGTIKPIAWRINRLIALPYLPTPPLGLDMTQGQFLSGVWQVWTQFFLLLDLTKAEEPSLPYYLPIAGGRIIGFMPFPRVLALCEMQSVSSRIWTRVAVSIPYDDNHYTTGTSTKGICSKVNIIARLEFELAY